MSYSRPNATVERRSALLSGGRQLQREASPERDIEDALDGMHERVLRLRRARGLTSCQVFSRSLSRKVVGSIDEEARTRGKLLDELEATVARAQAALKVQAKRIQAKLREGSTVSLLLFVLLFALAMLLALYFYAKVKKCVLRAFILWCCDSLSLSLFVAGSAGCFAGSSDDDRATSCD
jgi:hypothetical protein